MIQGHVLKKLNLDLLNPSPGSVWGGGLHQGQWGGGGLQAKHLLPCCCIRNSLLFGMQNDHVLNSSILTFGPPGSRGGGGVCGQNICCRVDAFVITFNFIRI